MTKAQAKKKYTRVVNMGGKWSTYLQIDYQGFAVADATTKKRADWFARMLASALTRLVKSEVAK